MPGWPDKLSFFRLLPLSDGMSTTHAPLLVGLHQKLARVARHWARVDDALAPAGPLVLLSDVGLEGFEELMDRLPQSRWAVDAAEVGMQTRRSAYELCKREVHRWLRDINVWMRGEYQGTYFYPLVRRVPGRGQSYKHWHQAGLRALSM